MLPLQDEFRTLDWVKIKRELGKNLSEGFALNIAHV